MLFLLQQPDCQLHYCLLRFLINLLHLLAQVVFEVDRVLLGVDVDLTILVEGVQSEQIHLLASFFFDLRAVCGEGNDFAGLLEV